MDGVAHISFEKEGSVASPTAMSEEESDSHVVGITLAQQHSLKKGLKLFGDAGDQAVEKELSSIHNMDTHEPLNAKDLSCEDRQEALESLLFLTEKRDGSIKARKVADGSKQRTYDGYEKSDGSSPTVITESIFSREWSMPSRVGLLQWSMLEPRV